LTHDAKEDDMQTVTSQDGTSIVVDRSGVGPPVVLFAAGPSDRSMNTEMVALLAPHVTVFNYDRRGSGDSARNRASLAKRRTPSSIIRSQP